jgi:hypothetical protein
MLPSLRQVRFGFVLIILSVLTYLIHFLIFRDAGYIMSYLIAETAFLFIQVLLVTLIIDRLLEHRELKSRLEKLNMVIGAFFSEVGTDLLTYFSDLDPNLDTICNKLLVRIDWTEKEFDRLISSLKAYHYRVRPEKLDLEKLRSYIIEKRDFLPLMMENPNLMEHESFSELLRSVFHLAEELKFRRVIESLPDEDIGHIAHDINRAYELLVKEWVAYMKHLKDNFPYLFSLAMLTNPFDQKASVVLNGPSSER